MKNKDKLLLRLVEIGMKEAQKKATSTTSDGTSDTSEDDFKLELIRGLQRYFEIDEDLSKEESDRLCHDVIAVKPIDDGRFEYLLDFTEKRLTIAVMRYGEIYADLSASDFRDADSEYEENYGITADDINRYYRFMDILGGNISACRDIEKTKGKGTGIGDNDD